MLKPKSWTSTSSGQRTRFLPLGCPCAWQMPLLVIAYLQSWQGAIALDAESVPGQHP